MKNQFYLFLSILCLSFVFTSCDSDDDAPAIVNEEEVITTLRLTLTPANGGNSLTFISQDLDGDGPNAPVISTPDQSLVANTMYNGTVQVLNETEDPAEDITLEVEEEDDEHQFFYTTGGNFSFDTFSYVDFDADGNPVGIMFDAATGDATTGTLTVTLRHEPAKPNTGLTDAGGETDIQVTFPITVE